MNTELPPEQAKRDWVSVACWAVIGGFIIMKVAFLVRGQSLASWLDVTNPSIIGLLFTASVITLIVRSRRATRK